MKRLQRTVSAAVLAGSLLIGAAGCGRADKNELEQELSMHQVEAEAETQTDNDADSEIPPHISYTVQGENSGRTMSVDADVISAGLENVSIYERTKVEVDDDWLRAFAEQWFDDGEYELVKPYEICSMEELLAEQEYISGLMENMEHIPNYLWEITDYEIPFYTDNYDESRVKEMPEGTLLYERDSISRFDSAGQSVPIRECRLRGNVDGERWELWYTEDCALYEIEAPSDYYMLRLYPLEPLRVQWGGVSADSLLNNSCDLESAKGKAEAIVSDFGYGDLEILQVYQSYCNDAVDTLDGYEFLFGVSVSDVKSVSQVCRTDAASYSIMAYNGEIAGDLAANQICMRVGITSEGTGAIELTQMFTTGERLTDKPKLLSFSRVDDAARSYMNERLNAETSFVLWGEEVQYDIQKIELSYVTILYEDNRYALVPVWVYYGTPKEYPVVANKPVFGITAVDGIVIQFVSGGSAV